MASDSVSNELAAGSRGGDRLLVYWSGALRSLLCASPRDSRALRDRKGLEGTGEPKAWSTRNRANYGELREWNWTFFQGRRGFGAARPPIRFAKKGTSRNSRLDSRDS